VLGDIIDLLLLIGAVGLTVLAYEWGRRTTRQEPADGAAASKAKAHAVEDAKDRHEAITGSLRGKDPATALADLGNDRRE